MTAASDDEAEAPLEHPLDRCPHCGRDPLPTVLDWRARFKPCGHLAQARISSDDPVTCHVVASWLAAQLSIIRRDEKTEKDMQAIAVLLKDAIAGKFRDSPSSTSPTSPEQATGKRREARA